MDNLKCVLQDASPCIQGGHTVQDICGDFKALIVTLDEKVRVLEFCLFSSKIKHAPCRVISINWPMSVQFQNRNRNETRITSTIIIYFKEAISLHRAHSRGNRKHKRMSLHTQMLLIYLLYKNPQLDVMGQKENDLNNGFFRYAKVGTLKFELNHENVM